MAKRGFSPALPNFEEPPKIILNIFSNSYYYYKSRFFASEGAQQQRPVHSFIHSGYFYSAPSRNLLRGALRPATVKEKCLKKVNVEQSTRGMPDLKHSLLSYSKLPS